MSRWCSANPWQRTGGVDHHTALLAQPAPDELAHLDRAVPALDQRAQDGPPRHPEVACPRAGRRPDPWADHPGELDVGRLQQLDQTAALGALVLDQRAPVAGQIAQRADRLGRDKAATHQAVTHQIGQPLGILHVALAALDPLDMLGVEHQQLKPPGRLQHGKDRHPVDPGALHADIGHPKPAQPHRQTLQPGSGGDKLALDLARPTALLAQQRTGGNHRPVHIQTRTMRGHDFHHLPPDAKDKRPPRCIGPAKILPFVLTVPRPQDGSRPRHSVIPCNSAGQSHLGFSHTTGAIGLGRPLAAHS